MPVTHKSAIKRARQSEKRHVRNHAILHRTRTVVKKFRTTIQRPGAEPDGQAADALFREAVSTLHKAATKGALHRNTASRRIAHLATAFNAFKAR
ncbi:MAG: 30S ribosomal protein S20 [Nitrospira sp.]|nr:30S ribosomal protein S20 [Nitrospira sp.]MDD9858833.1 30S ribosomal protein S20 [Nitrospira sp.]